MLEREIGRCGLCGVAIAEDRPARRPRQNPLLHAPAELDTDLEAYNLPGNTCGSSFAMGTPCRLQLGPSAGLHRNSCMYMHVQMEGPPVSSLVIQTSTWFRRCQLAACRQKIRR